MKPLQSVAMGFVIIVLTAKFDGYDALADPVGWLLVVLGVRRVAIPSRATTLAVLAGLVSVVLWLPATETWLAANDPSLRWAVNLPQVAFCIVLCRDLSELAGSASDRRARAWLRTELVLNVLLVLAPVLAIAGEREGALPTIYALAAVVVLALIVLSFAFSGRGGAVGGSPVSR